MMKPSEVVEELAKARQNPGRWMFGLIVVLGLFLFAMLAPEKLRPLIGSEGQHANTGVPPQAGLVLTKQVSVPGDKYWVPTGVPVRKGDWLVFAAHGEWWSGIAQTGPEGARGILGFLRPACGACPVPEGNLGELVGQVDGQHPFRIGSGQTVLISQDGELALSMNENTGPCEPGRPGSCYDDNRGEVVVHVSLHRIE